MFIEATAFCTILVAIFLLARPFARLTVLAIWHARRALRLVRSVVNLARTICAFFVPAVRLVQAVVGAPMPIARKAVSTAYDLTAKSMPRLSSSTTVTLMIAMVIPSFFGLQLDVAPGNYTSIPRLFLGAAVSYCVDSPVGTAVANMLVAAMGLSISPVRGFDTVPIALAAIAAVATANVVAHHAWLCAVVVYQGTLTNTAEIAALQRNAGIFPINSQLHAMLSPSYDADSARLVLEKYSIFRLNSIWREKEKASVADSDSDFKMDDERHAAPPPGAAAAAAPADGGAAAAPPRANSDIATELDNEAQTIELNMYHILYHNSPSYAYVNRGSDPEHADFPLVHGSGGTKPAVVKKACIAELRRFIAAHEPEHIICLANVIKPLKPVATAIRPAMIASSFLKDSTFWIIFAVSIMALHSHYTNFFTKFVMEGRVHPKNAALKGDKTSAKLIMEAKRYFSTSGGPAGQAKGPLDAEYDEAAEKFAEYADAVEQEFKDMAGDRYEHFDAKFARLSKKDRIRNFEAIMAAERGDDDYAAQRALEREDEVQEERAALERDDDAGDYEATQVARPHKGKGRLEALVPGSRLEHTTARYRQLIVEAILPVSTEGIVGQTSRQFICNAFVYGTNLIFPLECIDISTSLSFKVLTPNGKSFRSTSDISFAPGDIPYSIIARAPDLDEKGKRAGLVSVPLTAVRQITGLMRDKQPVVLMRNAQVNKSRSEVHTVALTESGEVLTSYGFIKSTSENKDGSKLIYHTASTFGPGSCGSLVFNMNGYVIGVHLFGGQRVNACITVPDLVKPTLVIAESAVERALAEAEAEAKSLLRSHPKDTPLAPEVVDKTIQLTRTPQTLRVAQDLDTPMVVKAEASDLGIATRAVEKAVKVAQGIKKPKVDATALAAKYVAGGPKAADGTSPSAQAPKQPTRRA